MNLDFPLILVIATAVTGAIYLADVLFFRPQRRASAQELPEGARAEALQAPKITEYATSFFPVLALVLVVRSFLFEPFQIPSGSMIPTLQVGDFILVNKYTYGLRLPVIGTKVLDVSEPRSGDVMVFIPPHRDDYFIKRVVGVPGDTVRYQDKVLYINGVEQEQEFVAQFPPVHPRVLRYRETLGEQSHLIERNSLPGDFAQEWTVPEGHYFMMGDNRDDSNDSRGWGLVDERKIVGKAVGIWMHKKPGLRLPEFSRNGAID